LRTEICHDKLYFKKEPEELSGIAVGHGLNDSGFESRQELGIFLFTTAGAHPTSGRDVKLTTHILLVLRSRMRGTIHPFPQYASMAWCSVEKTQGSFIFTYT
jgi:hypothetical protein